MQTQSYPCEKKVSIHGNKVDVDIFKGGKTNHQMNASEKVSSNLLVGPCNMPSASRLILK
jgi:hypothetical protein